MLPFLFLLHDAVTGVPQVANHVGHSHLHTQAIRCLKIVCERLGQQAWDACDLSPTVIIHQLDQHFQVGSMSSGEPARRAVLELIGMLSVSLCNDSDFAAHASKLIRLLSSAAQLVVDTELRDRQPSVLDAIGNPNV